jgi:uncharacterized protein YjbI with pentapeptide repeats
VEAIFFGADLRRVSFVRANMRRADLRGALVHGADLSDADLTYADLREGIIARKARDGELITLIHDNLAVNASEANFRGSDLSHARMGKVIGVSADFSYSIMRNTKLVRAHLNQAIMIGCDLSYADLSAANLEGADLRGAILSGATTTMMRTRGADMRDVILAPPVQDPATGQRIRQQLESHMRWHLTQGREGAPGSFDGLDMRDCDAFAGKSLAGLRARGAIFFGMDMQGCQLQGATLAGADLRGVDLSMADLRGANLCGAQLQRAKLVGACLGPLQVSADRQFPCDISRADLMAADLSGADLRGVKADGAIFRSAILDDVKSDGFLCHREES